MPQGDRAWVPAEKLEHYLLDETHPEGRNKATIFRSLLGITLENREVFERALLEAAATGEVRKRTGTAFGTKVRNRISTEIGEGRVYCC
jgi:hypothetical protein